MSELMLVRHAKSDWHTHKTDFERPLNKRGSNEALRMGEFLVQQDLVPDLMVVSAAVRARETAKQFQVSMSIPEKKIIFDKELYLADLDTLLEIIGLYAKDGKRLLVLAHNPGMDELVSYLSEQEPPLTTNGKLMVTCAVARLQFKSVEEVTSMGKGALKALYRPREIFS